MVGAARRRTRRFSGLPGRAMTELVVARDWLTVLAANGQQPKRSRRAHAADPKAINYKG